MGCVLLSTLGPPHLLVFFLFQIPLQWPVGVVVRSFLVCFVFFEVSGVVVRAGFLLYLLLKKFLTNFVFGKTTFLDGNCGSAVPLPFCPRQRPAFLLFAVPAPLPRDLQ